MRDESTGVEPFVGLIVSPFDPSVSANQSVQKYFHCRNYTDNKSGLSVNIPFRIRTSTRRYSAECLPCSRFINPSLRDDFISRLLSKTYAPLQLINLPAGNKDYDRDRTLGICESDIFVRDQRTSDANMEIVVDLSESPGAEPVLKNEDNYNLKRKRKQTAASLQAAEQYTRPLKVKSKKADILDNSKDEENGNSLADHLAGSAAFEERSRQLISSSSPILRCCCLTIVTAGTLILGILIAA